MRILSLMCILFCCTCQALFLQTKNQKEIRMQNYVCYIDSVTTPAKDYVLNKFREFDVVILSERYHMEETQYELINEIITDEYFISSVGNICVEIGCCNLSDSLNFFLKTHKGSFNSGENILMEYLRNISFYPMWNRDSYYIFLKNILKINMELESPHKINLFLCDREFDWSKINSRKDWEKNVNNNRDSIVAHNILNHYRKIKNLSRSKMLIILNEAHAITNTKFVDVWQKRAGQYLSDSLGNLNIGTIVINSVAVDSEGGDILLQSGYWDLAFDITQKYDLGFDFKGSPFGKDAFDYAHGKNNHLFTYSDIFTGYVFYRPIRNHKLSTGINGIITKDFYDEFLRRVKIWDYDYYLEIKKDKHLEGWNKKKYFKYDNYDNLLEELEQLRKVTMYD